MSVRVGILTLHYGFNEGAVLQAYALATLLRESWPDADVEVVDFRYPAKINVYGPAESPREIAIQAAIDQWLPLSTRVGMPKDDAGLGPWLSDHYDVVIYGSDVLWNLRYRRRFRRFVPGGAFSVQDDPFFPPFPNAYWPDESIRSVQIAFAASVGTLQSSDIPSRQKRSMSRRLQSCAAISVRDSWTHGFVHSIDERLGQETVRIADPTFSAAFRRDSRLHDASAPEIESRLESLGVDFTKPIAGFVCKSTIATRELAAALRNDGFQIVGITTRNDLADVNLFDHGFHPLEWARVFGFLDVCITERMHACIFCLLQQTPVVVLDINASDAVRETKHTDLMGQFELGDFCFPARRTESAGLQLAVEAIREQQWDWDGIGLSINELSDAQTAFLRRARAKSGIGGGESAVTQDEDPSVTSQHSAVVS